MVVSSEPPGRVGIWRQMGRAVVLTAAAAVAIPYTLAVLANTLYGWPPGSNRYRRALHPRKVYAMNYAILQQLGDLRYARLYFTWRNFYANAPTSRLIKNVPYGKNNNCLDVYLPREGDAGSRAVVVFVYGGSWGSGDKNMYGLLATQLADMLNAVVICPNYSLYPKGYVDDMVQDVVDTLTWVHHSAHLYDADKERILLLGHSAGGHLVAMATLELVMKRLLTNPESLIGRSISQDETHQSTLDESMRFEESHFNGSQLGVVELEKDLQESTIELDESRQESKPRIKLDDSGVNPDLLHTEGGPDTASTTGSFYFVDPKSQSCSGELPKDGEGERAPSQCERDEKEEEKDEKEEEKDNAEDDTTKDIESESGSDTEQGDEDAEDDKDAQGVEEESRIEELQQESRLDLSELENGEEQEDSRRQDMTMSQREVRDILSSIKAVIGLAGVYHIGDHYEHEAWRGVEDISSMGKAMYGPDFFDRFSPSHIVPNLPANTQFPPVHLLHGDIDGTVPVSSSTKFGQALWELGCRHTQVTVLPGCGHKEICVDLMDPTRPWYDAVMAAILDTAHRYL